MILTTIIKCSLINILLIRIVRGSPVFSTLLSAQDSEDNIRQTKAQQMLSFMNESVDPCEDFYEFTCGNYAKYNPISQNQPGINPLETLDLEMTRKTKALLETDDLADTAVDKQVKSFYRSCLSVPQLMGGYKDRLVRIINEYGHMPILEGDKWPENNFDWTKTVSQIIHDTGLSIIFGISADLDFADNSKNRVYIGEPTLSLKDRSIYVDREFNERLVMQAIAIANNLNDFLGVEEEELALKTAKEMIDFEIALAHGMADDKLGLQLSEVLTLVPISEVESKFLPHLDFRKIIGDAMGSIPREVYVQSHYVQTALEAVKNTPPRVVANYIFYTYLGHFIYPVSTIPRNMESFCMDVTKERFYKNLDNMLYRQFFTDQIEESIQQMWHEMKMTFRNTLQSPRLNWMQEDTRKQAVAKLKTLKLDINTYEKNNFAQEFSGLNLTAKDYVRNIKALLSLRGNQTRAKLQQPAQPLEYGAMTSFTPVYTPYENAIKLPVAILQPNYLWSPAYPSAYNFASLGGFVAHEILHGFDDSGRNFDAQGNERDWWDTQSDREFRNRTKCFVDQYKNYSYGGRPLPQSPSQRENIADNGGVRLAYASYAKWYHEALVSHLNVGLESLPGLNYTNNQLFFISYGQQWCANVDPDYMAIQAATDDHVPEKFRSIGPLSNFDEFSKAFNCLKGSAMNPNNKCEIY